ncbi:putative signal transduction histidine kinase [Methylocaldum marinum]|uniref:histidine kinase n=1 Tax=Methylocaldum marinum TaxID=1432792 RepID=A0A250KXF1_9GAMM|nr:HAMP domain-containing sensor histidine kinase [Methylocaldum marinum]BBA36305.1 putative signal transduction histidine kinase [Methylocaldum marinum]
MRLWPDTLAGRILGLLVAGLFLTMIASLSIYMLDLFHGKGWDETFRTMHRTAVVASILNRAPPDLRPTLVPVLSDPALTVAWQPGKTPPVMASDAMTRHLARDVRVLSKPYGLDRVEAGYTAESQPSASDRLMAAPVPPQVWVALSDGTWLRFSIALDRVGALATLRLLLAAGVSAVGIMALGFWAARKVTAPLARFALAAQRLGANMDAPPMSETGPREIRHAAVAFNDMQNRIRRLIEDRTLMLGAISHDVRTALTRLRFRTELIEDPGQRRKAAADLDQMEAMLNASLSFARDDAAAEAPTVLDLSVLLQSLCDDFADAGRPVSYEGPLHLKYLGRPVSLRRAFANLIDNAVTYGYAADVVLADNGDAIEVCIGDRGPGIPEAMRDRVFAPFFRLESSRSRKTGGTGLGLSIARMVVRRHGGEIVLDDRAGGGLLVKITLPAVPSSVLSAPE